MTEGWAVQEVSNILGDALLIEVGHLRMKLKEAIAERHAVEENLTIATYALERIELRNQGIEGSRSIAREALERIGGLNE